MVGKWFSNLDALRGMKTAICGWTGKPGKVWTASAGHLGEVDFIDDAEHKHRGKVGLITKLDSFCMGEWVLMTLPNGEKIEVDIFEVKKPSRFNTIMYLLKKVNKKTKNRI